MMVTRPDRSHGNHGKFSCVGIFTSLPKSKLGAALFLFLLLRFTNFTMEQSQRGVWEQYGLAHTLAPALK
jgi:hypothetical protein